ncbi:MAG: hypothetical protein ACOX4Q_15250 [Syntrophomonadales bacterium]|jgi:hypothetical protein
MKKELKNRLLTLLWSTALMSVAYGIDYIASQLGMFDLSVELTTFIGLVLAQITKYIRNLLTEN